MSESSARLVALAYSMPLAIVAAIGVVYWWRVDRAVAAVAIATISYMVVMSLGAEAYSRFRVPILPLYAMLAGGGVAAIVTRGTGGRRS